VVCPSLLTVIWPRCLERQRREWRDALRRRSARAGAGDHLPWAVTRGSWSRKMRRIPVRTLLLVPRLLLLLLLVGWHSGPLALRQIKFSL